MRKAYLNCLGLYFQALLLKLGRAGHYLSAHPYLQYDHDWTIAPFVGHGHQVGPPNTCCILVLRGFPMYYCERTRVSYHVPKVDI